MIENLRTIPNDIKHYKDEISFIYSESLYRRRIFLVGHLRIILRTHLVTLRSIHIVSSSQDTAGVTLALTVLLSVCV